MGTGTTSSPFLRFTHVYVPALAMHSMPNMLKRIMNNICITQSKMHRGELFLKQHSHSAAKHFHGGSIALGCYFEHHIQNRYP